MCCTCPCLASKVRRGRVVWKQHGVHQSLSNDLVAEPSLPVWTPSFRAGEDQSIEPPQGALLVLCWLEILRFESGKGHAH